MKRLAIDHECAPARRSFLKSTLAARPLAGTGFTRRSCDAAAARGRRPAGARADPSPGKGPEPDHHLPDRRLFARRYVRLQAGLEPVSRQVGPVVRPAERRDARPPAAGLAVSVPRVRRVGPDDQRAVPEPGGDGRRALRDPHAAHRHRRAFPGGPGDAHRLGDRADAEPRCLAQLSAWARSTQRCRRTWCSASTCRTPARRSGTAASCRRSTRGCGSCRAPSRSPTCGRPQRPVTLHELEQIMLRDVNVRHAAGAPGDRRPSRPDRHVRRRPRHDARGARSARHRPRDAGHARRRTESTTATRPRSATSA